MNVLKPAIQNVLLLSITLNMSFVPVFAKGLTWQEAFHQGQQEASKMCPSDKANEKFQQTITLIRKQVAAGKASQPMASSLMEIAQYYQCGQFAYKPQEEALTLALQIDEKTLGPTHADLIKPLSLLALLPIYQKKWHQAEPLYRRISEISEKNNGPDSPKTIEYREMLALILAQEKRYEEAEKLYQDALATRTKANDPNVAVTLSSLGSFYQDQQKYELSESYYLKALALQKSSTPKTGNQYWFALSLYGLATIYHQQGRFNEAQSYYAKALQVTNGKNDPFRYENIIQNMDLAAKSQGPIPEKEYPAP